MCFAASVSRNESLHDLANARIVVNHLGLMIICASLFEITIIPYDSFDLFPVIHPETCTGAFIFISSVLLSANYCEEKTLFWGKGNISVGLQAKDFGKILVALDWLRLTTFERTTFWKHTKLSLLNLTFFI